MQDYLLSRLLFDEVPEENPPALKEQEVVAENRNSIEDLLAELDGGARGEDLLDPEYIK